LVGCLFRILLYTRGMNNEPHYETLQEQLNAQQDALVQIYKSVEKTRKYILWTGVVNAVLFILPLIIFLFALPKIMSVLSSSLDIFSGLNAGTATEVGEFDLQTSLENLKNLGF